MSGIRTGLRVGDQQAEHPAAVRQVADRGVQLGVDAVGDEVGQLPVGADDAEGRVPGAGQLAGRGHDALQHGAQVEVAADADDGVEQRAEPFAAGHDLADAVQHLLQQLVEPDPGQRAQTERRRIALLLAHAVPGSPAMRPCYRYGPPVIRL